MSEYAQAVAEGRWVIWFIIQFAIYSTVSLMLVVWFTSKLLYIWKEVRKTKTYHKLWDFLFK